MSTNIIEDLNWRYACKKFDPTKKLTDEQLNCLQEALRMTPSSYGVQPWKFLLVNNTDLREKMVEAAYNQRQVADASHVFVLCRPKNIDEKIIDSYLQDIIRVRGGDLEGLAGFRSMLMKVVEKPDEVKIAWAKNQIYIALGNLMTVCAAMRIDATPMEGFSPTKIDEILGLDQKGLKSVLLCPVGFRAADDKYISIKKVRYQLKDVLEVID
jgi:nitroreductase / dihydropteridine reductase